jgi:hypothetical protein
MVYVLTVVMHALNAWTQGRSGTWCWQSCRCAGGHACGNMLLKVAVAVMLSGGQALGGHNVICSIVVLFTRPLTTCIVHLFYLADAYSFPHVFSCFMTMNDLGRLTLERRIILFPSGLNCYFSLITTYYAPLGCKSKLFMLLEIQTVSKSKCRWVRLCLQ